MATTFNPYKILGEQLVDGLDTIAAKLTNSSTVDDLVNEIYKYIQPIYYSGKVPKVVELEIKSVAYSVINTYINSTFGGAVAYSSDQYYFIDLMLLCPKNIPVNGIADYLSDVEDSIVISGISIVDQTPLLLAINDGQTVNKYWNTKVEAPDDWAKFFNRNPAINYANIPFWTAACMQGSLIGSNASSRGLISPTTDIVTVQIVSSLIGALSIGAGKIIFNWTPKINLAFGGTGGAGGGEVRRRENTGSGSYTESGISVSYTADFVRGNTRRYYFT